MVAYEVVLLTIIWVVLLAGEIFSPDPSNITMTKEDWEIFMALNLVAIFLTLIPTLLLAFFGYQIFRKNKMEHKHEIVKFSPAFYNEDGVYCKDEWTSVSDIGKCFNGDVLTKEEYFAVESNYVDAVCEILQVTGTDSQTIEYIEKDDEWIEKQMENSKIPEQDLPLLPVAKSLREGQTIGLMEFRDAMRLCLREYIYAVFTNRARNLKIEFGYDYYMYVDCPLSKERLSDITTRHSLFLDPR